ncbi:glycosyltransferase family 4 protein [Devosia sediminis]|uniref:Glycosyltransferase family 4 protein n=1 Tax=Devosia sediminis TaxID=2798801 RepID=A0A934IUF2_9HYPH|nr:glycosyltransferase family 4 protein [Devosia sediminis]MBJ3783130.1 glycosyltransferase family 4 protein [Devosia sediminis]
MRRIEFMVPVPPVPLGAPPAVPRVLILVPDQQGGIARLFEQMQNGTQGLVRADLMFFPSHDGQARAMLRFPQKLLAFWRVLKANRIDACHINLSTGGSTIRKLCYAFMCRAARVPYVIHLHGGRYPTFLERAPTVLKRLIRSFFLKADRVIVLGSVWREFVARELAVPPGRIVVLPNAVAGPRTLPARRDGARLLLLGRIGPDKGVPELLEALASPAMQALDWTATIAGDGEVETYRQRAAELGLASRVTFPGWVDGGEVAALLEDSSIIVLPSHVENLPLSMLEGMGYGLCPVVTPVGAVEDVIRDGVNGLLVPVGDAKALAEGLARVCSDEVLRHRLAGQARTDFLAHYDIRDYRARLEAVYLDVIHERSGRR